MNKAKSQEFNRIARDVFAPIYPIIASQIVDRAGIKNGVCVDLGSGPAHLAIAVTKITGLTTYAVDSSEEMYAIAGKNIQSEGLSGRIKPIISDVNSMPFCDGSIDLIVSRGSFFFWEDLTAAFKEVYRVLKPGGKTYIGGGFGSPELKSKIAEQMRAVDENWEKGVEKRWKLCSAENFMEILSNAGISQYDIIDDDSGFWIMIKK